VRQHVTIASMRMATVQPKQLHRLLASLADAPVSWRQRCVLIMVLVLTGCASGLQPRPEILSEQAPFIRDGETTQFAVQDHYGPPANRYEGGHVITYVMRRDRNGQLYVLSSKQTYTPTPEEDPYPGVYNLVLVFGEDGVLERHALLQVR
jgi:hypothetical protein